MMWDRSNKYQVVVDALIALPTYYLRAPFVCV